MSAEEEEVDQIEDDEMGTPADIVVSSEGDGYVTVTLSFDSDPMREFVIKMDQTRARSLGEHLFKVGCAPS